MWYLKEQCSAETLTRRRARGSTGSSNGNDFSWESSAPDSTPIVEITYVDDEAITIAASSPRALWKAINFLLQELIDAFSMFGFQINWNPGKTEAFVTFRGKHVAEEKRKLFGDNGGLVRLPKGAGASHLRVVDSYVHLGSELGADGNPFGDVSRRLAGASASYSPVATKVFGSWQIDISTKLTLASSLVFSRLLYNVQTWSKWSVAAYRRLNAMYMTVLRRISGKCRYNSSCDVSDRDVRSYLNMPSLQCLIIRSRLSLLGAVLRSGISSLAAMLATALTSSSDGCFVRLPWVQLVREDLTMLFGFHACKLSDLGCPTMYPKKWLVFIAEFPHEWSVYVKRFFNFSMPLDIALLKKRRVPAKSGLDVQKSQAHLDVNVFGRQPMRLEMADPPPPFRCLECSNGSVVVGFMTSRALHTRARVKHNKRNMLRFYLDGSGICPVCRTQFESRLRVLAHVSETRCRGKSRITCRSVLESGKARLIEASEVARLDELDRIQRRTARRAGRSHAKVCVPAKRSRVRAFPNEPICVVDDNALVELVKPHKRLRHKTTVAVIRESNKRLRIS